MAAVTGLHAVPAPLSRETPLAPCFSKDRPFPLSCPPLLLLLGLAIGLRITRLPELVNADHGILAQRIGGAIHDD